MPNNTTFAHSSLLSSNLPMLLICFYITMQHKIEEAEKKYKQIQEQLEGITQQVQELQPKCADLKAEAQKHNILLKSSEVSLYVLSITFYIIITVNV